MKITVTYGSGQGSTKLAAFDHALWDAGIGNYNLIKISSIIPKNAEIVVQKLRLNETEIGYKLYVVIASCIEDIPGKEAWAGLGWIRADHNGPGLFMEQVASTREECMRLVKRSLHSVTQYRLEKYSKISSKLCGIQCKQSSVCAIVAALYESEHWLKNY